MPGSGPVAFGSFAFRDDEPSLLVVPEVVLGRRDGQTWLTTIGDPPRLASPEPVRADPRPALRRRASIPVTGFRAAVAAAVGQDRRGRRWTRSCSPTTCWRSPRPTSTSAPCWPGWPRATPTAGRSRSAGWSGRRRSCWCAAPVTGSSPGSWPARRRAAATPADDQSRVRRPAALGQGPGGAPLRASSRWCEALAPHVRDLDVPDDPARARAVQRHAPGHRRRGHGRRTARTCSTCSAPCTRRRPSAARRRRPPCALLARARGDGPRPLRRAGRLGRRPRRRRVGHRAALRRSWTATTARLFAGCGIVAGSDPDAEVPEAQAKLVPMRDALEGVSHR